MRAPLWLILLIVLAIVGLGVYGYFTTPLPLGLSSVIRSICRAPCRIRI